MQASQPKFQIFVEVRSARNLENKKLLGNNAPYVELKVGNEIRKTHIEYDLIHPSWNETFVFDFNHEDLIPSELYLSVQDDRALLPNLNLGDYIIHLNKNSLIASLQNAPFFVIRDGLISLQNSEHGQLDVKIWFSFYQNENVPRDTSTLISPQTTAISSNEFNNNNSNNNYNISVPIIDDKPVNFNNAAPVAQVQELTPAADNINHTNSNNVVLDSNDINNNNNLNINNDNNNINHNVPFQSESVLIPHQSQYQSVDQQEFNQAPEYLFEKSQDLQMMDDMVKEKQVEQIVHVLPTLKLKEKPIIIEKEIEYEKPIQIRQTIIHKETSIIIEQPIIKQKHEHYREQPEIIKRGEQIFETEIKNENDNGSNNNLHEEEINKLRLLRSSQYFDETPIIQHEKEHIQLDTLIREVPAQIHETKVVYQQPIEIESVKIEKIKPTVVEEVIVEKEHIHEKAMPEIYTDNATFIDEGHQYYQLNQSKPKHRELSTDTTTTSSISTNKDNVVTDNAVTNNVVVPDNREHVIV